MVRLNLEAEILDKLSAEVSRFTNLKELYEHFGYLCDFGSLLKSKPYPQNLLNFIRMTWRANTYSVILKI